MTDHNTPYTLITGASNGLGKCLAIECARRRRNLILTALPGEGLPELSEKLEQDFGIRVRPFELDLTELDSPIDFAVLVSDHFKIDTLINNAGLGGSAPIDMAATAYIDRIIMLNVRALSILTQMMIPKLIEHPRAHILNVSSMSAFSPIPFKTVYPASKAFVTSFSKGLAQELKGTNIKISILHPGNMLTNDEVVLRTSVHRKWVHTDSKYVAKVAIDGMLEGKEVIIPGNVTKLGYFLIKTLPYRIRMKLFSNVYWKECEKVIENEDFYRSIGVLKKDK